MKVFVIGHDNRPGEIAKASSILGGKGINITSSASLGLGERGATAFITSDEPGSRAALDEAGLGYVEYDIVRVRLPDQPGTLADASRRLADAGINIEFLAPTAIGSGGEATLAFGVADGPAARRALGDQAIGD